MQYLLTTIVSALALSTPINLAWGSDPQATSTGPLADSTAFSRPVAGLDAEQKLNFKVGRGFFRRLWVTPPASTQASDGLGPLYNARSCMSCHPNNGRGRPPEPDQRNAISFVLKVDMPPRTAADKQALAKGSISNIPEPTYGLQFQDFAVPGHAAEYRLGIRYEAVPVTLADGSLVQLRKPIHEPKDLGYGPLHPRARLSPRVAPPMIGLGLLEAIEDSELLAAEDPEDADGDGISGRANRAWSIAEKRLRPGRFGHKAALPTLDQQSQLASNQDLGLSTPLYPLAAGDCTGAQAECLSAPDGNSPQYDDLEAPEQVTSLVLHYVSHIAVPAQRRTESAAVALGRQVFERIGCQQCHRPTFQTSSTAGAPANRNQTIHPYTDLLLHDMGEGLADGRPEGAATGREWRTTPLWGIGLTEAVNGNRYFLHDGRARSLLEAILWHGGESQRHRDAVVALQREERQHLIHFLESL